MFQTFNTTTTPQTGARRIAALRRKMAGENLDGFIIPRADAHQGEYVADCDKRLEWLTGFTGSAGFCVVLEKIAAVFIDGRYTLQVKEQVDPGQFTPVDYPANTLGNWIVQNLTCGQVVGFDPWLHTKAEIDAARQCLSQTDITLRAVDNLVDRIWSARPPAPTDLMVPYDIEYAGKSSAHKRAQIAEELRRDGHKSVVITQPDGIAWLLNTRGTDLGQTPVALAFAMLEDTGHATLFIDPAKVDAHLRQHLGHEVTLKTAGALGPAIDALQGPVLVDKSTSPVWLDARLRDAKIDVVYGADPILLAKACKNKTEIANTTTAHVRDGTAMAEFLAWMAQQGSAPELAEIDVVRKLEHFRTATGALKNISFETICGSGSNGAIMHYRVTEQTNRKIETNSLLLVDSGGQYLDGTTDITRTIAVGTPPKQAIRCFTLVLKGLIALSCARFPKGLAGRDLDPLARYALWQAGMDFDHGTGHGVGVYLSVHEGPQRISRISDVPLQPGMILSNEPGYYRPGHFGIRIENLIVVEHASRPQGGDEREMLQFKTLTLAPIDKAMIDVGLLTQTERQWLNTYHTQVLETLYDKCSSSTQTWLDQACAPL